MEVYSGIWRHDSCSNWVDALVKSKGKYLTNCIDLFQSSQVMSAAVGMIHPFAFGETLKWDAIVRYYIQ